MIISYCRRDFGDESRRYLRQPKKRKICKYWQTSAEPIRPMVIGIGRPQANLVVHIIKRESSVHLLFVWLVSERRLQQLGYMANGSED